MQFTDEEAAEVKKWVVNKLEDISDADSDVLADYVLALIRSDAPDDQIRKASVENLDDFLREHTVKFVDELFVKFNPKPAAPSPVPLAKTQAPFLNPLPQPTPITQESLHYVPPTGRSQAPFLPSIPPKPPGGLENGNGTRKRTYEEGFQAEHEPGTFHRDRTFKTPRRGNRGTGRGDWSGRDGRGAGLPVGQFSAAGAPGYSVMPPPFPLFDQSDPMAAMLAFQSMGFPQIPGMPPLPIPPAGTRGQPQPRLDQGGRITEKCPFYETQGICYLGAACPYQHGTQGGPALSKDDEYDPKNSNIVIDLGQRDSGHQTRTVGERGGRGRGRGQGERGAFAQRGGRGRSDFSAAGPNEDRSITTIVVEQIPEDKFDEPTVREFFAQYGDIESVTLQPYKRIALIKYDTYDAAKGAWSSPKVIFDNRFVKVYWYKPANKPEKNGERGLHTSGIADGSDEGPLFDKEEFGRRQQEAQKAYEEKLQKRKEAEEAKQTLERQRDELLKKQQEEKARLMQKLAAKGASNGASGTTVSANDKLGEEGDENVSEQTKQLRSQLAALEAEAKSLGIDPETATQNILRGGFHNRGRGFSAYRRRGGFVPRGRGYDPSNRGGYCGREGVARGFGRGGVLRLDNRPKRVAVSGVEFDTEKDEALRQYLIGIGEYESIEQNPDRPDSLIVAFKERFIAEKLAYGPRSLPGVGEVEFSWLPNPPTTASSADKTGGTYSYHDGDKVMTDAVPESESQHHRLAEVKDSSTIQQTDVDYDVAEEDDRWS